MTKETITENKKNFWLMGAWAVKELTKEEVEKWDNISNMWNKSIKYKLGDFEVYNISEVDAARLVENYLNKVGVEVLTWWQKLVKFLLIWIAWGIFLSYYLIRWNIADTKDQVNLIKEKVDILEEKLIPKDEKDKKTEEKKEKEENKEKKQEEKKENKEKKQEEKKEKEENKENKNFK